MSIESAATQAAPMDNSTMDELMSNLIDSIDEGEAQELKVVGAEDQDGFHIENRGQAEYFTKMYNQAKSEVEATQKTADDAIAQYTKKVRAWQEGIEKSSRDHMMFFGQMLREWAEKETTESGKKSVKLIEGTLSFRNPSPKFTKDDDALRTYFGLIHPEFLEKMPDKVKWAEIKKAGKIEDGVFKVDGQPVPGVEVETPDVAFSIK